MTLSGSLSATSREYVRTIDLATNSSVVLRSSRGSMEPIVLAMRFGIQRYYSRPQRIFFGVDSGLKIMMYANTALTLLGGEAETPHVSCGCINFDSDTILVLSATCPAFRGVTVEGFCSAPTTTVSDYQLPEIECWLV